MSHDWTTPADLRQQVQRLWDRGKLLEAVLDKMALHDEDTATTLPLVFPLRLRLRKPSSHDISNHFSDVRTWIKSISNLRYTRLELLETRHPQVGRNEVPQTLWIDSLEEALTFIGKRDQSDQFRLLVQKLITHDSQLLHWVRKRPVKVLELASVWDRLIRVHNRIVHRPDNTMYLRQLSVPGVDTKFIESHRATLTEWLDLTLSEYLIDENFRGTRGFVRRYGFKDKPTRLRLRSLDIARSLLGRGDKNTRDADGVLTAADITLDVEVIRILDPSHRCVMITENEINYLAVPDLDNTLAIFGSGYGLQSLGEINWLKQRDVWYWGDLDTHGFAILNELRGQLPQVRSWLMDRYTLMAHESLWGYEANPANRKLEHLTDEEADLYRDLVENRYGDHVRLEQEQIDYEFMVSKLCQISQPSVQP